MSHHHESNHQDVLLSIIRILIKFLNKNHAYALTRSIGKKYCESILGIVRSTYYHNYFRIPDTFYNSQHYDQITRVCEYAAIYDPRQRRKEHLQKISYNDRFNEEIKPGDIPDTVTVLSFGQSFNTRLEPGVLPKNLKSLKFIGSTKVKYNGGTSGRIRTLPGISSYNKKFSPGVLDSLEKLRCESYNEDLDMNVLPGSLQKLILGSFNKKLAPGVIPHGLTYLDLGKYNHSFVPGILPPCLKYLKLGDYNHQLGHNILPHGLISLRMIDYNQPLDCGVLPGSITDLHFVKLDFWRIRGCFPKCLKYLEVRTFQTHPSIIESHYV